MGGGLLSPAAAIPWSGAKLQQLTGVGTLGTMIDTPETSPATRRLSFAISLGSALGPLACALVLWGCVVDNPDFRVADITPPDAQIDVGGVTDVMTHPSDVAANLDLDLTDASRTADAGTDADADADGQRPPHDGEARETGGDAIDADPASDGSDRPEGDAVSPDDRDGDQIPDAQDNCPDDPNPDQADRDEDGEGDACDPCPDGGSHADEDDDGVRVCQGDCDDALNHVWPGAPEICDGLDNDCDERVDEDYADLGRPCRPGVGACRREGEMVCADEGASTLCGVVAGEPEDEDCDGADNDCDGLVDEDLPACCEPMTAQPCGLETGLCRQGIQRCGNDRHWGACLGTVDPTEEVCNGRDDDCDGLVDDGVANACGTCGPVPVEVCNGDDDDCDGQVDEGLVNACGMCAGLEVVEICNGRDDDCDGQIDEGVTNACGECGPVPIEVCNLEDDDCDGEVDEGVANLCLGCGSVPDEVCNGVDDDCDGQVDEGLLNACGTCGLPPEEVCNREDDDCDGQVDEGLLNACGECGPAPPEICDGRDNNCDGQIDEAVLNACGRCGAVPAEACNGLDDDCDGQIDEGVRNLCGDCGPDPQELCNGVDEDCDGQIDEGLMFPCASPVAISAVGPAGRGLGRTLVPFSDINGDGVPDAIAAAPARDEQGESIFAISGADASILWRLGGTGRLGQSLAVGDFDEDGRLDIAAGAPDQPLGGGRLGLIVFLSALGVPWHSLDSAIGSRLGAALAGGAFGATPNRADLAVGDPYRNGSIPRREEIGRAVVVEIQDDLRLTILFDARGSRADQRLGARIYAVPGVQGGLDVAATQRMDGGVDREVIVFRGSTGQVRVRLHPPEATWLTFGESLASGRWWPDGEIGMAVGAPGAASQPDLVRSGVVHFFRPDGAQDGEYSAGVAGAEQGRALAALPRPDALTDALVVGASDLGTVHIVDRGGNVVRPVSMDGTDGFGWALAVTEPLADGTRRLFVGEPGFADDSGRIHVYSVR